MSPSTSGVSGGGIFALTAIASGTLSKTRPSDLLLRGVLPSNFQTGLAPAVAINVPGVSCHDSLLQREPGREPLYSTYSPPLTKIGRGATSATNWCASAGRSSTVRGPAYLMKFGVIQWYSLGAARLSTCSPTR